MADEEEDVRKHAAHVLGRIGGDKAVLPLINAMTDANGDVRESAARALIVIGDRRAIQPFVESLKDDEEDVRFVAIMGLALLGDKQVEQFLFEVLKDRDERGRFTDKLKNEDEHLRNAVTDGLKEVQKAVDEKERQEVQETLWRIQREHGPPVPADYYRRRK